MADRYEMVLDLVDNASSAIYQVKDKLLDLAQNATGTTKALGIAGLAVGAAAALSITALNNISEAAHAAVQRINEIGDTLKILSVSLSEADNGRLKVAVILFEEPISVNKPKTIDVCDICKKRVADKKCLLCNSDNCSTCRRSSFEIIMTSLETRKLIGEVICCKDCKHKIMGKEDEIFFDETFSNEITKKVGDYLVKLLVTKNL